MPKTIAAALVALVATAASTAPAATPPTVLNPADCSALPTGHDIGRYYPAHAARMGIGGKVLLRCVVGDDGSMHDCAVASETPRDEDFGAAAMKVATLFRLKPTTRDGAPTAGKTIVIPLRFAPQAPRDLSPFVELYGPEASRTGVLETSTTPSSA